MPQFKYKISETFGKTTHDLLTAPEISRSNGPVLTPLKNKDSAQKERHAANKDLIRSRNKQCGGDQKYGLNMVPGYTGKVWQKGEGSHKKQNVASLEKTSLFTTLLAN